MYASMARIRFDALIKCLGDPDVSFGLGSALARSAIPLALALLPARAGRQPVTHRGFDLVPADADILQRTVVELLELANSAAAAPFGGEGLCPSFPPQDEHAQPLCSRLRGQTHAGLDHAIALDTGLPLELEERERRSGIVFLEHARTSTQDAWTLLLRRGNRRGGQPLVEMSTRERIGPLEGALGPSWSFRGDFLEMPEIGRCQGLRRAYGGSGSGRRRE